MNLQPALIVVISTPPSDVSDGFDSHTALTRVTGMVEQASVAGLMTVCVVPSRLAAGVQGLPAACRIFSTNATATHHGIAHAVQATPHHPGWLVLPASAPVPKAATFRAVAHQIAESPVVVPAHDGRPGYPAGFASEFYSELARVRHEDEISRMLSRYPVTHIAVDEPEWVGQWPWTSRPDQRPQRLEVYGSPVRTALPRRSRTG
jgi:CTP:molybdopterin cytidylyltransferase MocA